MASLEIRTAEQLADAALEARRRTRRVARETDVFRRILRSFVAHGGPIPVEQIVTASPDHESATAAIAALDDDDLIRVRNGQIDVAYPFAAIPTAFVVTLPDGGQRYACCANGRARRRADDWTIGPRRDAMPSLHGSVELRRVS